MPQIGCFQNFKDQITEFTKKFLQIYLLCSKKCFLQNEYIFKKDLYFIRNTNIFCVKIYFWNEIYIFYIFICIFLCKKKFFSLKKFFIVKLFFHIKTFFSGNNVYFVKNTNVFSKKNFFNLVLQKKKWTTIDMRLDYVMFS